MSAPATVSIAVQGDCEIVITRHFQAPPQMVYDCHTRPELVKRWLGVRGGWELVVCDIDLRVGGAYRYVWRKASKNIDMGMGGVFREIAAAERIVCTVRFDDPWYPGEGVNTSEFLADGGGTLLRLTVRYVSAEARDMVMQSPMEKGLAESYDMLAQLLAAR
jgi:uncharacterized protein YndB with AHSA1/START domain